MRFLFPLLAIAAAAFVRADVVPAPLFADHAVLQRGRPIPVWGTAAAGEKVAVTFRDQSVSTSAAPDGRWLVKLPAFDANAEPATLTIAGKNTVVFQDVVVGEVWLCSGQSNMELTVARADNAPGEIAVARFPLIRHLGVKHTVAASPATTVETYGWQPCSPETVGNFTAVGYFFAREIHQKVKVPVGLIHASWGGTQIESWLDDATLRASPHFVTIDGRWQAAVAKATPERVASYPADMETWQKAEAQARATKTKNPLPWPAPLATPDSPARPSGLFNGMISPFLPASIAGVLWYQGETNVGRAAEYAQLFPALVQSWRAKGNAPALPFLFVQLPNYADGDAAGRAWAELREAQSRALALPATGMAVTIDIGDRDDIHPTHKQEVGRRLALLARAQVYEQTVDFTGPRFATIAVEGKNLRVRFTHAESLTARGQPPQAFEIAGADKKFFPAAARIDGNSIVLSAREVAAPVAARFAWTNSPTANLYNGAGLPMVPFRSDAW